MIVYKITNKINGKIYIGQTVQDLNIRFNAHCYKGSGCTKIYRAIRKYGKENFTIEIIEVCDSIESLNKAEEYWIKEYSSIENGYNLTTGGLNNKFSKETKEKLSIILKKRYLTKEAKKKRSEESKKKWQNPKYRKLMTNISKKNSLKIFKKSFKVYKAIYNCEEKSINQWKSPKKGPLVGIWENKITCAKDLEIARSNISDCLNNKTRSSKGYIFEYIKEKQWHNQ